MKNPTMFIGSSSESLNIANQLQLNLCNDIECTVWDQDIFQLSSTSMVSLALALKNHEFATFVFAPDDIVTIRGEKSLAVRDNVIFELGLFIGKNGLKNTFIVVPNNVKDLHIPTDLTGIILGTYNLNRFDGNLCAALGPVCTQIKQLVLKNTMGNSVINKQFLNYDKFCCSVLKSVTINNIDYKNILTSFISTFESGIIKNADGKIVELSTPVAMTLYQIDQEGKNLHRITYGGDVESDESYSLTDNHYIVATYNSKGQNALLKPKVDAYGNDEYIICDFISNKKTGRHFVLTIHLMIYDGNIWNEILNQLYQKNWHLFKMLRILLLRGDSN